MGKFSKKEYSASLPEVSLTEILFKRTNYLDAELSYCFVDVHYITSNRRFSNPETFGKSSKVSSTIVSTERPSSEISCIS